MHTDPAVPDSLTKLTERLDGILNASLNGIIAYEAVRNNTGTLVDFTAITLNQVAQRVLRLPDTKPGWQLLDTFPGARERGFFDQYVQVVETGKSLRFETQYGTDTTADWYDVSIVRMGDGFVITFNDITAQRQTNQALEYQKNQLNGLVDNVQTGLLVLEPVRSPTGEIIDLVYTLTNTKAAQILGRTVDETTGRTLLALDPDAGKRPFPGTTTSESVLNRYSRQIREGGTSSYEFLYEQDGIKLWFQTTANALSDREGIVISFADITAIKQTQQVLEQTVSQNQQQATLLSGVLNGFINGVMAFGAIRDEAGTITDFRFITINQASEQILGVSIDTMMENTLLSIFPGNVESGLFALYVHTTETGQPSRTEVYYNHDDLDFWIDVSAQQLGDGFVVTFTDTSVVKRAAKAIEQAALASEQQAELLNTVLNNSQTAISMHEAIRHERGHITDFRAIMANNQAMLMWGEDADAIMSRPFSEVATQEQQALDFPKYVGVVETGEPDLSEFSIGGQRLLRLTAKSGDGVVISNIDITRIHQLQRQLETSVIDLKRSNANLEQFAYVASHDLQEPLRKIRSFGDIISTQYASRMDEHGLDLIRRIQSAAERMQALIKDVLAYSRIAARRENLGPVDLNPLINYVLNELETAITERKAIITVGPLPTLTGDMPQLRQLFQNLFSNALKFARPNTVPTIGLTSRVVRGADSGQPVSAAHADRLFHLIELQDNGIGFDPQYAERIFEVFQRLHNRSLYDGTGIGLAIVQKVVENHQGYIVADGKPGQGAVFRILLPVAD